MTTQTSTVIGTHTSVGVSSTSNPPAGVTGTLLSAVVTEPVARFRAAPHRWALAIFFMVLMAAPITISMAATSDQTGRVLVWGFAAFSAVACGGAMWAVIRPGKLPVGSLVAIATITSLWIMFGPTASINGKFTPDATTVRYGLLPFLGVGFNEELTKAIPVFLILTVLSRRTHSIRTYMFAGAVSGIFFGLIEDVGYQMGNIQQVATGHMTVGVYTDQTITRLLQDSWFHAGAAVIAAYFIGLAAHRKSSALPLLATGVALAASLHAINDTYSGTSVQVAVAVVLAVLVIVYAAAAGNQATAPQASTVSLAIPVPGMAANAWWTTRGTAPATATQPTSTPTPVPPASVPTTPVRPVATVAASTTAAAASTGWWMPATEAAPALLAPTAAAVATVTKTGADWWTR